MKKRILTGLLVLLVYTSFSQAHNKKQSGDPFVRMICTLFEKEAISFNAQFVIKQVFDIDTVKSKARVTVVKKGTDVSFLRIIPEKGEKELLYCKDSAWMVSHTDKKMLCLGDSFDNAMYNELSSFFPSSLFSVDTLISQVEPYWRVIDKTKDMFVVSLDIANSSPEFSDFRVEFNIGRKDYLPYRTIQESLYMNADRLYQEQDFSDYSFPDAVKIRVPDYFSSYQKDFSLMQNREYTGEDEPDDMPLVEFLPAMDLHDLNGNVYNLPGNGLIFLDFWYVGCPPCMKSATIIEKTYETYKDRVHFLSVNETDQDTAKINRFKTKMGITFPVLLGGTEKVASKVSGNNGYPVFILFDGKSRKILWKFTGYTEKLEEMISSAIEQHL
jgi:thiol-disulfide isomerase/thioredoxin